MASTYLQRTISSAGSNTISTLSVWVKLGNLGTARNIYSVSSGSTSVKVWFNTSNQLVLNAYEGGFTLNKITSRVFRDTNSFYHILVRYDTTDGTAEDRVQLYVNGTRETSFGTNTNPSASLDINLNENAFNQRVGADQVPGDYFDGSMAHFHWIDGTAYDASTFGETDTASGIWKPKTSPSVTYGTNGFFLKFANSGSLGTDSSGNGNNLTVNGTGTQTLDTPSNVFATMNPLNAYYSGSSFSNGNLTFTTGTSQYSSDLATLGVSSGKYYWEVEFDVDNAGNQVAHIGIKSSDDTNTSSMLGGNTNDYAYRGFNGQSMTGGTSTAYGNTYAAGDIVGVALDLDNNKLYFSKNGTWQNSGDPTSGATGTGAISITDPSSTNFGVYIPAISYNDGSSTGTFKCNFGNGYFGTTAVASGNADGDGYGIFEYAPPTGYYALCTKNINNYG